MTGDFESQPQKLGKLCLVFMMKLLHTVTAAYIPVFFFLQKQCPLRDRVRSVLLPAFWQDLREVAVKTVVSGKHPRVSKPETTPDIGCTSTPVRSHSKPAGVHGHSSGKRNDNRSSNYSGMFLLWLS